MVDGIIFNGRGAGEFGVVVEHCPAQNAPKRKLKELSIPGRNGTLHYDEGAWENVKVKYEVYFRGNRPTAEHAHGVKQWLMAPKGYCRLEDKYDPSHFRLASFAGPLNIENLLNLYGRCDISFNCDPRCFLKDGEEPVSFESPGSLYNQTGFDATPLIYVYGNGAGEVSIGGVNIKILQMTASLALDCESMNAYAPGDASDSRNADIYAPEFPVLKPGRNVITWGGGVTAVKVIPRWWEL